MFSMCLNIYAAQEYPDDQIQDDELINYFKDVPIDDLKKIALKSLVLTARLGLEDGANKKGNP